MDIFRKLKVRLFPPPSEIILFEGRSDYRKLTVIEKPYSGERVMYAANRLYVASINLVTGFPLYTTYFLSQLVIPWPKKLLFLGGGPNAVPSYVWKKYKPGSITVIERDELNTVLAEKYFNLPKDKNYNVIHKNAIDYIKSAKSTYDLIFFNIGMTRKRGITGGDLNYFCTLKGIKKLSDMLTAKGVLMYILNIKLTGEDLIFGSRCLATLNKCFKKTYIFSDFQSSPKRTQLVLLICCNKNIDLRKKLEELSKSGKLPENKNIYEELLTKEHTNNIFLENISPFK